jgi:hypothetical protein
MRDPTKQRQPEEPGHVSKLLVRILTLRSDWAQAASNRETWAGSGRASSVPLGHQPNRRLQKMAS